MIATELKTETLNKFAKLFVTWLEDSDYSYNSQLNFWKLYINNINFIEESKNKYLYDFSSEEIKSIIENTPSLMKSSKKTLFCLINRYLYYCIDERGFNRTRINPCNTLDLNDILGISADVLDDTYEPLSEFYQFLDTLNASPIERVMIAFLRYGVNIKYVGKITMVDIDRFDMKLHSVYKGRDVYLPIDEKLLTLIDSAIKCTEYKDISYKDSVFIIKPQTTNKTNTLSSTSIYNKINFISQKNGIPRISINKLSLNRKFDLLYEQLKKQQSLNVNDVKTVLETLQGNYTSNKVLALKEQFELMTNINIESFRKSKSR